MSPAIHAHGNAFKLVCFNLTLLDATIKYGLAQCMKV